MQDRVNRESLPARAESSRMNTMASSQWNQWKKEAELKFLKETIERVLREAGGSHTKAAKIMGIDRSNFLRLLRKIRKQEECETTLPQSP
jgi:transcriptional regulator with PAS, ATPase and Fis domain